jgi:hypothetical protein
MAILKFEIDTDDMFQDYDPEFGPSGESFEQLFRDGLSVQIQDKVTADISKVKIDEISEKIKESVVDAVENKLMNLINEDVVISDRWGKSEFIGSVEDYIKKQIDEKMLSPVDSYGKKLEGCTSTTKSWIEWKIEQSIDSSLERIKDSAKRQATDFCKNTLQKELENFKNKTLKGAIVSHLDSLGIIKS